MKYTIQPNHKDWYPKEPLAVFCDFQELRWEFTPDESMAFDYAYQGGVDRDWADWKKFGGVSLADFGFNLVNIFLKSRDSIQLGGRWNIDLRIFEYAVYVNEKGAHYAFDRSDQVLRMKAGTRGVFLIRKDDRKTYRASLGLYDAVRGGEVNEFIIKTRKPFRLYSRIGLWYGGRNNSPGPWGGKAPKPMKTEVTFFKK